ncbi:heme exporter protein CcmD [Thalassospira sp.]|uniref:heme exporter protein CcmD n=1 Tax=Thalassospira sp. TaxID=1912094 RepID=UPI0027329F76|nr:heme exporter protein CcmD [Thalassospira sp.]MDP2697346.1 heme exporter protein CcmD [Thalassospira sp.]
MSDYFMMEGYGLYIWSSYAITAVAMVFLLVTSLRGLGQSRIELDQLETLLKSRRPRRSKSRDARP